MALQIPYTEAPTTRSTSVVPEYMSNRAATPEAFGAAEARGLQAKSNALEGLASGLQREAAMNQAATNALAEEMRKAALTAFAIDKKTKADVDGQKDNRLTSALVEFEAAEQRRMVEEVRKSSGGEAIGWQRGFMENTDKGLAQLRSMVPPGKETEWDIQFTKVRTKLHQQAFTHEMQIRDATQKTTTSKTLDTLTVEIQRDPTSLQANIAKGKQVIATTNIPEAEKRDLIAGWEARANYVYSNGLAVREPQRVLDATQSTDDVVKRRIKGSESSGDPNAKNPGSTATGLYQFIEGTWNTIADSPEGRAAGLGRASKNPALDARRDPVQQEKAMDILLAMNKRVLAREGLPASPTNLYAMHFFGGNDGPKFLKALAANPSANAADMFPTAANANPKWFWKSSHDQDIPYSLAQVYAILQKKMGADPAGVQANSVINALPPKERDQVIAQAERSQIAQDNQATAIASAKHADALNNLYVGLLTGAAGRPEIKHAYESGLLNKYEDLNKAQTILQKVEKEDADYRMGMARINAGAPFNPYSSEDKSQINAVYEKHKTGDPQQDMQLAERLMGPSKIMPDGGVAMLRQGINSINPQEAAPTLEFMRKMGNAWGPNIFKAMPNGAELEDAYIRYSNMVHSLGSTQEAARRFAEENTTQYKSSIKINEEQSKAFLTDLQANGATKVFDAFGSAWPWSKDSIGMMPPDQRAAIGGHFADIAMDFYRKNGGDTKNAEAYAIAKMKNEYYVSQHRLMRWAPELAPAYGKLADGNTNWIYEQAAAEVRARTGETEIEAKDVYLIPLETYTAQAFNSGALVPYGISYLTVDKASGQQMWKQIYPPNDARPQPWVGNKVAAEQAASMKRLGALAEARASEFQVPPPTSQAGAPFANAPKIDWAPRAPREYTPEEKALIDRLPEARNEIDRWTGGWAKGKPQPDSGGPMFVPGKRY